MAGITDPPFRAICREHGMPVAFSEMVSSAGLCQRGKRTLSYIDMAMDRGPTVIQIFGAVPERMAHAAEAVEKVRGVIAVDINMGCPVKKVLKTGAGCALMSKPDLAARIVSAVKGAVKIPVLAKFRSGLAAEAITAPDLARMLEQAGVDAVSVHARTASQGYSGNADWKVISKVKRAVNVPVLGNGDVRSAGDAEMLLSETGCDGVMVGRGCLGNPWLFGEIASYLRTGEKKRFTPSPDEVLETALRHLDYMVEYKGNELAAVRAMRKHLVYYTKGVHGSVALRPLLMKAETLGEVRDLLQKVMRGAGV
jgi:nifR3 family TIM-barrel protein